MIAISKAAGMRRVSGRGGRTLLICRHTAATKQKPEKRISTLPVAPISQLGTILSSNARAPMPEASAASPVRTQAA